MELKKINTWSLGKIGAILGFIFGVIWAIILLIAQAIILRIPALESAQTLTQIPPISMVILPFYYAITFFILGVLVAFLYNFFAKYVGGIKFELTEKIEKKK